MDRREEEGRVFGVAVFFQDCQRAPVDDPAVQSERE